MIISVHLACTTVVVNHSLLLTKHTITKLIGSYTMASWSMLDKHLAAPLIHPCTVVQLLFPYTCNAFSKCTSKHSLYTNFYESSKVILDYCASLHRKLGDGDFCLIYYHYATLYFAVFRVDSAKSELGLISLV